MSVIVDPSFLPQMLMRAATLLCDCLDESTVTGRPGFCGLYHSSPPADCCDALLLWVASISATERFPSPYPNALRCGTVVPMATIGVKLFRPCWPVTKTNPWNPLGGIAEEATLAAVDLEIDAVALFCCLMSDLSSEDGVIRQGRCDAASIGSMTPGANRGGCASWSMQFTIELPGCCPMLAPVTG